MARPTEYNPEYCDCVIAWGREGKSLAWMASELDVSKQTVHNWMAAFPEFLDAMTRAKAHSQRWWEDKGQTGIESHLFNGSVWAKSMAARFPDDWRDNKGVELTGANGGAIQQAMTVEFVDAGAVPGQT